MLRSLGGLVLAAVVGCHDAESSSQAPGGDGTSGGCFQVLGFVDGDGDGFGSGTALNVEKCSSELPPGYAALGGDCDDSEPITYPMAPEQWDDGVDSDCNGAAQPADCDSANPQCGCERLPGVDVDGSCSAEHDLFIAEVLHCQDCGPETIYAFVGNQGGVASPSAELTFESDEFASRAIEVPPLQAGEVSLPLMLSVKVGPGTITIAQTSADCHPDNDAEPVTVVSARCL